MELDDIRLKELDEMTDDEKKFLVDNKDSLTDEEKGVFKDILTPEPPPKEGEAKDEGFKFTSEEEFVKKVTDSVNQTLEEREKAKKEAEKPKDEGKETDYLSEKYQPKNWNEADKELYGRFEKRIFGKLPEVINTLSAEQRKKVDEHLKVFDQQTEDMRKKYPDFVPEKGTSERDEFDADVAEVALKYGTSSLTGAIEIYKLTKEKGGGVPAKQKSIAGKIGKGGSGKTAPTERKYSEIHNRSMDDLADEALEELDKTS